MLRRKKTKGHNFTDYERGFLEALIDGEGNLTLMKSHQPIIEITNTSLSLLEKAKSMIDEDVTIAHGVSLDMRHKDYYKLRVLSQKYVLNILGQIRLTTKAEQQHLLLWVLRLLEEKPPQFKAELEYVKKRMNILNARGQQIDRHNFKVE